MPKPIVNNRINYQNIHGRVIQHDLFLDQGVRNSDSPTFANLQITGNTTIEGNLYVEGNTSILNTNIIEFEDNIILINSRETGNGVTLFQSGLEIERGSGENFRIVYNEANSRVEVGLLSNLQPITIRQSAPLPNGLMTWDDTNRRIESSNQIVIPVRFSNTTNSISSTTGSLIFNGGIGIEKDVYIDGRIYIRGTTHGNFSSLSTNTSNNLIITSTQDINMTPNTRITIPVNKYLSFGSNNKSIFADTELNIISDGDIKLTPSNGKKIKVPNQIPITFSTDNEQIYTDSGNNIVIASSQDVYLYPNNGNANGKKVFIPVDTPLVFSNSNQYIIANSNNDLTIAGNNNILINPGFNLDVKIPIDSGIKFGSGNQRITANSANDLFIYSQGDISITPQSGSKVKLPVNIPLTLGSNNQSILGDINGNILISSNNLIITSIGHFRNTTNSINGSTGAVRIDGGLGVVKDIYGTNNLIIKSNSSGLVQFKNNANVDLFKIDASTSNISILTGNGLSSNASLDISNLNVLNAQSLIQLKANYDSTEGYMIGRGTSTLNNGRTLTFNLPNYTSGNKSKLSITSNNCSTELFSVESETGNLTSIGEILLSNTKNSTSVSVGALIVNGGIGIKKDIYTDGKIIHSTNDINAYQLKNNSGEILVNNDSISKILTINEKVEINNQNVNGFKITDSQTELVNIDTVDKIYISKLQHNINNTIESIDTSSGSLIVDGGIAIKKRINVGGIANFANSINMNNTKISNVLNPTLPQDAATKAYVDLVKQGLFVKDSVRVATLTNININAILIIGGIVDNQTLVLNDRVLVKNQSNAIENGIYVVTNTTPVRSDDLKIGDNASGTFTFVKTGDINASLGWICNSPIGQDIVGTNNINFTQFTGLGQVTVGLGLTKNFNQISANVDNISIETTPLTGELRIKNTALSTGLTGGSGSPIQTLSDQSHVTKLGIINTGTWEANIINVTYGGTGRNNFTYGNILFGNNSGGILTDANFYYDTTNKKLGIGTNTPNANLEISSNTNATLFINADKDANNSNATPEIRLSYNGTLNNAYIGLTRNFNQFANQVYNNALVISNDQTTTNSRIQFATNQIARMTILSNGFVGINTSNPSAQFQVNGTMNVNNIMTLTSTKISTSITEGAMIIDGGISIKCSSNSTTVGNGGALTVGGGVSIEKDLYIGGSIKSDIATQNSLRYLSITATDCAVNLSTGSLLTSGGITIKCSKNAMSVTDGGSLLTPGGAAIGSNLYVGKTIYALSDVYLNNLYFYTDNVNNYIQSPNLTQTTDSFLPINFTKYNNTNANSLTISDTGIITSKIQIGGTLNVPNGYTLQYISNNLNVIPTNNYDRINIGTVGNYSNINIYGNNAGQIIWNSSRSNLLLTKSSIELNKLDSSGSIICTTPDTNSESFIQAKGSNMILNIGNGSTGGQLITKLSNNIGNSTITFTPSNTTYSNLSLTNNIQSTFEGPITLSNRVEYSGNALHQTINNTNGNALWIYMGLLNTIGTESGYCEVDFNNGINASNNNISGLKVIIAINNTSCIASHLHYGNLIYDSVDKPICYIYNDSINDYHLFVKLAPNSQTNINVTAQKHIKFSLDLEGTGNVPSGIFSGYDNSWFIEYTTQQESTLKYTLGDLTVEGTNFEMSDNLPILGLNNKNTISSRDIGMLFQRYQKPNNLGAGDVVNSISPQFIDTIPSQTLMPNLYNIKFSNSANSTNDYYKGWWIKIVSGTNINQVRQITSYNGAQRVAVLSTPFTNQNPDINSVVNLYNKSYVVNYYDETNETFSLSYTNVKPTNGIITNNNNANLRINGLYTTDTTPSTNSSTGSVYLLGGISINNTNDAINATYGGSITTAGGASIKKNLRIGDNLSLGDSNFTNQANIHIRKSITTARFEHDTGSYSHIDFMENNSNTKYGIIFDSNTMLFSLTNTTTNQIPLNANKALTINNLGYVGINTTTNMVSPFVLNRSNFISTNSSTGYLGLVGAASNTNNNSAASRILLYANNQSIDNQGCLNLYAGNITNGNIKLYTNNDIERVRINYNGNMEIFSTDTSSNLTSGSLITSGGITIKTTQNATSMTRGGALTVNGGTSIAKDLYIGGNLYIDGNINVTGSIMNPSINHYNAINCTFIEYYNNNLYMSNNFAHLSFAFNVMPTNSSENCEIEFNLPDKTTSLTRRFDVVSTCTGYSDDTNVIPLMNVLSYGIPGTQRFKVKFQSTSTSIHYFQVILHYIL